MILTMLKTLVDYTTQPKTTPGTLETYPMIEVPNSRASVDGQQPSVYVYHPWMAADLSEAARGVTPPWNNMILFRTGLTNLIASYRLNEHEIKRVVRKCITYIGHM